jgi:hypothetical protein
VGPCEASNFIYPMEGPFTVGFGMAADFVDRPMPELVASDRLEIIDGGYRLLIRVAAMARWGSGPWEELRHYAAPAASYFTDGTNLTLA